MSDEDRIASAVNTIANAAEKGAQIIAQAAVDAVKVTENKHEIIFQKFDSIRELMEIKFAEVGKDIAEVKKKQDYTNGDVSKLKLWRSFLLGAWAVTSILIIPLTLKYLNTKSDVQAQVRAVMSEYYDKNQ